MARRGAAPAQPQSNTAGGTPLVDPFLRYARTQPFPVQIGTLAAGNSGGQATSFLTWNPPDIPEVPGWVSELDLAITLPVAVVIPAGANATISPYAPYSAFTINMLLAGSPEWPNNTSLVPFWLDEIMSTRDFDPFSVGPNLVNSGTGSQKGNPLDIPAWFDAGTVTNAFVPNFSGGTTVVLPGSVIHNGGTAAATTHFIMSFLTRLRFQRKRTKMWGMVPLGDPQNRPQLKLQLNALVGGQPENNLIQDIAAAGITATVDTGGVTCNAVFRSKSLDILPGSVTQLGTPQVALGLNVTYDNSFSIQNAGAILYQFQRTAQIYTKILHCFVNKQAPIDVDYFALWLNQNRQSARWEYDMSAGTLQDYYADVLRKYHRYLPNGVFVVDMEDGDFPDIPRETPYNALMSPDTAYAGAAGVAATPNLTTAFRIPSGTVMSGAYAGIYTFGLVRVPY